MVVIYLHGRNSAATEENQLETRCKMFVSNIKEKYWLSADNQKMHRTTYSGECEWKITHLMHPEYELRGVYKDSGDTAVRVLMFNRKTERFFWYLVE